MSIIIDGSGRHGQHGHAGGSGYHAGADGSNGGDGASGEPGSDITLKLRANGQMITYDTAQRTGQHHAQSVGDISLRSHGGNGGNGGDGGNGAKGSTGHRGQDATKHRHGTDGGRGGSGGDAGHAGNGGNGGRGGVIVVDCPADQAFMLLLVEGLDEPLGWAKGGQGGAAGTGGSGGSGGDGGAGGSAFHWTTEHWDERQVHHGAEYDAEGKCTQKAWVETVYDKRIEHHTTPGGNTGPRGPGGSDGRNGSSGSAGADGRVTIHCGGHYERRYVLSVAAFDVVAKGSPATPSAASDQIYEFGECCHVQGVKIANRPGSGRAPRVAPR